MYHTLSNTLAVPSNWWKGQKMVGPYGQMSLHGAIDRLTAGDKPVERWENGRSLRKLVADTIKMFGFHGRITRVGDLIGEFNDHPLTTFDDIRKVCRYVDDVVERNQRTRKVG